MWYLYRKADLWNAGKKVAGPYKTELDAEFWLDYYHKVWGEVLTKKWE